LAQNSLQKSLFKAEQIFFLQGLPQQKTSAAASSNIVNQLKKLQAMGDEEFLWGLLFMSAALTMSRTPEMKQI